MSEQVQTEYFKMNKILPTAAFLKKKGAIGHVIQANATWQTNNTHGAIIIRHAQEARCQ